MYSSIEKESREEVIKKCYWPIFELADIGIPIGIEAPAITLDIINSIDPKWLKTLSEYVHNGQIEFIGSGYSQVIGPLLPAEVNYWNQKLGVARYEKYFGFAPKLALTNEMAYSSGILEHYKGEGVEALIMEWNNPKSMHQEWENEWRYFPQRALDNDGGNIPIIWADSIGFQKFQRYAHKEYELEEFVNYLKLHAMKTDGYFPLYSNDVEIFDYRPGRYQTEAQIDGESEWKRIHDLYNFLREENWCSFVFPSEVLLGLENSNSGHLIKLESPNQPILVKKQEKYNINRWALTGRDDIGINTKCYQIYREISTSKSKNSEDWRELCYLWSSDFRTHITHKRWIDYIGKLDHCLIKWNIKKGNRSGIRYDAVDSYKCIEDGKWLSIENDNYHIKFNKRKGFTIQDLSFKRINNKPLIGTLAHGYYDDIALGADFYSGHAIIERLGKHKDTDLAEIIPKIEKDRNGYKILTKQPGNDCVFVNRIQLGDDTIDLFKAITYNSDEKSIIHPFNFTVNPETWDHNTLYVETHNGGSNPEIFYLCGQNISHGNIYSSLISARYGFGNSEGIFSIGDKNKKLTFKCDMTSSAMLPSIVYNETNGIIYFRLRYSAQEIDETTKLGINKKTINSRISISISWQKNS